jgi:NTP pyrophosphatase (non-canonical NTP hydrolase)
VDHCLQFSLQRWYMVIKPNLSIRAYQTWVRKCWDYTDDSVPLRRLNQRDDMIMNLGLAGETGEVLEIIKKHVRSRAKKIDIEHLKEELGDVLYYLTMIAARYKIELQDIMDYNYIKCEKRKAEKLAKRNKEKKKR